MLLDFFDGFKFVLGWLVGKFVFHFVRAFVHATLRRVWPWYREFWDDCYRETHPEQHSAHED